MTCEASRSGQPEHSQRCAPALVFIDHTTTSANVARELAAAASQHGLDFLDCPVSGGQAGAEAGSLTVMAGGDEAAFAHAEPLIKSYAGSIRRMGPAGSGQLAKMANQIAVAGVIQGLAEAIHFGECAGLDIEALIATISKGAAQSWQMDNRWRTMHAREFDFGFAVDWMRKDLAICLDEAGFERRRSHRRAADQRLLWRGAGARRQSLGYVEPHRPP